MRDGTLIGNLAPMARAIGSAVRIPPRLTTGLALLVLAPLFAASVSSHTAAGSDYTVCLDPGHTLDRDPGAVAKASFGAESLELREVDVNLDVAHALREALIDRGLGVIMTWDGAAAGWPEVGAPDDPPPPLLSNDSLEHDPEGLEARGRRCVEAGADAMFSVHHNALEEPGDGLVTLFRDPGSGQRDRDHAVAQIVHEAMWGALGRSKPARPFTDFGLFFQDWGVARGAIGIPTVILEPVVMTDPDEARWLTPTIAQGGERRTRIVEAETAAILAARDAVFGVVAAGPQLEPPERIGSTYSLQAGETETSADAVIRMSTASGLAPLRVDFSSPVERAFLYAWSFGDGGAAASRDASHVYATPGLYVVRLAACSRTPTFECVEATATVNVLPDETGEGGRLGTAAPAHGSIGRAGDSDEWVFAGTAGDLVRVAASADDSSPLDTVLRLIAPDGGLVAFSDDADEGTDSRIGPVQLPLAGDYVVEMSGFGDSVGAYSLELELALADSVVAAFSSTPATAVVPADVAFTNESRNAASFAWDFGDGSSSTERSPTHHFQQPGSFLITLTACRDAACSQAAATIVLEADDGGVLESDQTASGLIDFEDDVDSWLLRAPKGAEVSIALTSPDGAFDPMLFLRGPGGDELAMDDDGGEGVNARIANFIVPVGGELVVDALGFPGSGTGLYELSATVDPAPVIRSAVEVTADSLVAPADVTFTDSSLGGPISSSWEFGDGAGATGREVSHRFERAGEFVVRLTSCNARSCGDWTVRLRIRDEGDGGPVSLNETAFGAIDGAGDSDDWLFSGQSGQVITVAVIADDLAFDPVLDVIGPDGELFASDDDNGGDLQPLLDSIELPDSGEYILQIRGVDDDARGSYRIDVTAG